MPYSTIIYYKHFGNVNKIEIWCSGYQFFPPVYEKRVKNVVIEYVFYPPVLKKCCQEKFDTNRTESEMSQDSDPNFKKQTVLFLPSVSQDKDLKNLSLVFSS